MVRGKRGSYDLVRNMKKNCVWKIIMNLPCHISGLVFMGSTCSKGEGGGGVADRSLKTLISSEKTTNLAIDCLVKQTRPSSKSRKK